MSADFSSSTTSTPNGEPPLSLRVTQTGAVTVLELDGDLDVSTTGLLLDVVSGLRRDHPALVLVLDLSRLRFFGADGLRAFLHLRDLVPHLTLRDPSPFVRRVMSVTDTLERFDVQARQS